MCGHPCHVRHGDERRKVSKESRRETALHRGHNEVPTRKQHRNVFKLYNGTRSILKTGSGIYRNKTTTVLFGGKVRPTVEGKSGSGEHLLLGPHSLPRTQSWWVSGAEACGSQAGSRVTLPGQMSSDRCRDRNRKGCGEG